MADATTATILVTDVVGSTEARVRLGEEGADALRRTHDDLLRTAITDANGEVIKGLGDGILAMFDSASDAVTAAVAIQQGAYAHNRQEPDQPLDIRVGLSAGDPFPYDFVWLMAHALLGHAAAAVGTPEQAERQYEILLPYADRIPSVGNITWHSTHLDLALLAARLNRREEADRHFAAADAIHERLNAPVWLARTRLEWGRFLLDGDGADSERARALLADALTIATRTGCADVVEAARGRLSTQP